MKLENLIIAAAVAMAMAATGALLDGPSDHEAAQAVHADITYAKAEAREAAILESRCKATRGPSAELVIVGTNGDYACRIIH